MDAIKIIAEQQAEIERLRSRVDELLATTNRYLADARKARRQFADARSRAERYQDMASRLQYPDTTGQ